MTRRPPAAQQTSRPRLPAAPITAPITATAAGDATITAADPVNIVPRLLSAVAAETGQTLHNDDVTCLLLRANGTGARLTLAASLAAPIRLLRGLMRGLLHHQPLGLPELSVANIGGALFNSLNGRWGRKVK